MEEHAGPPHLLLGSTIEGPATLTIAAAPSPGTAYHDMDESVTRFHRLVQIYCEILQVTKPTTLLTSLRYDTSQQRLTEDTTTRKTFTPGNVTELEHIVEQRLQILSREQKLTLRKRLWRKNITLPNLFP